MTNVCDRPVRRLPRTSLAISGFVHPMAARTPPGDGAALTLCVVTQLKVACEEIVAASVRLRTERTRGASVRWLLARTDAMIEELEVLNLREVERLDATWSQRLGWLVRDLPFVYEAPPRQPQTPTQVLDWLFDLQAGLLAIKSLTRTGAAFERFSMAGGASLATR